MFQIIEVFLGFSIGIAILWVTILALVKFHAARHEGRRVAGGFKRPVEKTIKRRFTGQGFGGFERQRTKAEKKSLNTTRVKSASSSRPPKRRALKP
jgi:hypothetical protein